MTTRALNLVVCAAALATLAPQAARGSAADVFEHKVKPVSGQLYQKAGKLELTPLGSISVNDAFFNKYMGGAKLGYHVSEYFSLAVSGVYGTSSTTGSRWPASSCRSGRSVATTTTSSPSVRTVSPSPSGT